VKRDHRVTSLEHDLINVVLGPRRAGKSFFAIHLLKQVGRFGYANFDDERLFGADFDQVLSTLDSLTGSTQHLLLDEIQNLPRWQLVVNRLQRQGRKVTVTGSNAHLLGEELATHLTGRHLPIVIFPFSFREYLSCVAPELTTAEMVAALDTYAEGGGYPEVIVKKLPSERYLSTLVDSIVLKDVVKRFKVRFVQGIDDLRHQLMANTGSEYTYTRLAKLLDAGSVHTVKKYVRHLEAAFLFFSVPAFSFKASQQARSNKKVYCVDNGLITTTGFRFSPDLGRLLENIVAIELHKRSLSREIELYYWKGARNEEVDFVVKRGLDIAQLIQVCVDVSNPKTRQRETRGLLKAADELGCGELLVLTRDYEHQEDAAWYGLKGRIRFVPLWKWLVGGAPANCTGAGLTSQ
jgi:predicted AAA+ superfamily ATPase